MPHRFGPTVVSATMHMSRHATPFKYWSRGFFPILARDAHILLRCTEGTIHDRHDDYRRVPGPQTLILAANIILLRINKMALTQ